MDPATIGALAGAGASVFGGIGQYYGAKETNAANLKIARETNAFNAAEAAKNRGFQEQMSNTSHQREVADLKAAGLNPILSAQQGAGTPSGSAATGATATMENPLAGMATTARDMVDSVLRVQKQDQELKLMSQQGDLATSQKRRNDAETASTIAEMPYSKTKGQAFEALGRILKKVESGYVGNSRSPGLTDLPDMLKQMWDDKKQRDSIKIKLKKP